MSVEFATGLGLPSCIPFGSLFLYRSSKFISVFFFASLNEPVRGKRYQYFVSSSWRKIEKTINNNNNILSPSGK